MWVVWFGKGRRGGGRENSPAPVFSVHSEARENGTEGRCGEGCNYPHCERVGEIEERVHVLNHFHVLAYEMLSGIRLEVVCMVCLRP